MADAATERIIRTLARELAEIKAQVLRIERGLGTAGLGHSSIESGALVVHDADGVTRAVIGLHPDGSYAVSTPNDTTALPTPAAPTVTPIKGGLRVAHDGRTASGTVYPASFSHLRVYYSVGTSGTVPAGTISPVPGEWVIASTDYTDAVSVWCTAVNNSGTESAASSAVTATPLQSATPDIAPGAITAELLAGLLVLASRLVAGDPTGARAEINSTGIEAFTAGGAKIFDLDIPSETLTVVGTYLSGLDGVERVAIFTDGTMQFINADGTYSTFENTGIGMRLVGPADAAGRAGQVEFDSQGATLRYGPVKAVSVASLQLTDTFVTTESPFIGLRVDTRTPPSDATANRVQIVHTDTDGNDVATTLVNYVQTAGKEGQFLWPAANVGILASANNTGSLWVSRADPNVLAPVTASAYNTASGAASKTGITDLGVSADELFAVYRGAPVKRFRYRSETDVRGHGPGPMRIRHIGPHGPVSQNVYPGDTPEPEHLFPLADDLAAAFPALVSHGADGSLFVDLRDLLGFQWATITALIARVDALTPPVGPGRPSTGSTSTT